MSTCLINGRDLRVHSCYCVKISDVKSEYYRRKRMKKSLIGLSALVVLFTLSGCGLKGPLYFPPEENAAPTQASDVQPSAPSSSAKEPAQATSHQ